MCTDKLLHADAFTHRGFYAKKFYTPKFLYTDALHKDAFTRINKGTQALLHTEPFAHRNLCTEQFLHKLLHRKVLTQKKMPTQTAQRSFYTPKLLHAETLPRAAFTYRNFSATEAFTHRSLYAQQFLLRPFYPQMPLHRKTFTHRNFCTQHALTHSQLLHAEALLPLLDHLPFVFPLSSSIAYMRYILWLDEHGSCFGLGTTRKKME